MEGQELVAKNKPTSAEAAGKQLKLLNLEMPVADILADLDPLIAGTRGRLARDGRGARRAAHQCRRHQAERELGGRGQPRLAAGRRPVAAGATPVPVESWQGPALASFSRRTVAVKPAGRTGVHGTRTQWRGWLPTALEMCPRPLVSSIRITSPGPTMRVSPSLAVSSRPASRLMMYCARGAGCQSCSSMESTRRKMMPLAGKARELVLPGELDPTGPRCPGSGTRRLRRHTGCAPASWPASRVTGS